MNIIPRPTSDVMADEINTVNEETKDLEKKKAMFKVVETYTNYQLAKKFVKEEKETEEEEKFEFNEEFDKGVKENLVFSRENKALEKENDFKESLAHEVDEEKAKANLKAKKQEEKIEKEKTDK